MKRKLIKESADEISELLSDVPAGNSLVDTYDAMLKKLPAAARDLTGYTSDGSDVEELVQTLAEKRWNRRDNPRSRHRNPSLGNDPSIFRKHASLRILQDQIYKDKGQLVPLDTLREMILDMAKQARTAGWKVVEGGKRRANPGRDAAATAVAFLRKYGSQALGWAKTAASIHRGLRDRIFWRKVYNCILRSLKRGDPLPNPRRMMSNPGPGLKKTFVVKTFLGPVYRFSGKGLRWRGFSQCDGVGGYHRRAGYAFIPGDEIWIEKMADGVTEERYLLGHEMMEIAVMRVLKWGYQRAHNAITPFELRLRKEECPKKVFQAFIAKFFPKATPTAVHATLAGLMHGYRRYH